MNLVLNPAYLKPVFPVRQLYHFRKQNQFIKHLGVALQYLINTVLFRVRSV